MKSILFAIAMLLVSPIVNAKTVELQCSPVEAGGTMFESLKLKLQSPDDKGGSIAPGEWMSQKISLSYGSASDAVKLQVPMKQLDGENILKGGFEVGNDFGTANLLLVYDYDNENVVAVIQVSTDGPITVETQRCK